ncbi:MAG: hypothetical protein HRU72_15205 [Planctomycetia bacterium]|nr:MAG: hypothetical protein HRU72_15205 [Planctomycetia bacterium]
MPELSKAKRLERALSNQHHALRTCNRSDLALTNDGISDCKKTDPADERIRKKKIGIVREAMQSKLSCI